MLRLRQDGSVSAIDFIAVSTAADRSQPASSPSGRTVNRVVLPSGTSVSGQLRAGYLTAQGKYILFATNGCRIDPQTVRNLIGVLDRTPSAGICGIACSAETSGRSLRRRLWHTVVRPDRFPASYEGLRVDCIDTSVFIARREVAETIGFPETFLGWRPTVADFSLRAARIGWEIFLLPPADETAGVPSRTGSEPLPGWFAILCFLLSYQLYPLLSRGFDLAVSSAFIICALPAAGVAILRGRRPSLPKTAVAILLGSMGVVGTSPGNTSRPGWTGLWRVLPRESRQEQASIADVRWTANRCFSLDARIVLCTVAGKIREMIRRMLRRPEVVEPA